MVTHGVRELVSPDKQAVFQQKANLAEASSAPQEKPKHEDITPAIKADQKIEIPLESTVKQLNDYLENAGRSVSFSIHQDSGKTVVKVFNSGTDELIRQFPAEQVLKLAEVFQGDDVSGLLLNEEA